MEKAITTAARVRRQLRAGRPRSRSTSDVKGLNSFSAMGLLATQADRASELMEANGLDATDLRLGLIIRTKTDLMCKWLPSAEQTGPFFEEITKLKDPQYLGILWQQIDRDIKQDGVPQSTYWVTPFVAEPKALEQMKTLEAFAVAGGLRTLAN